MSKHTAEPGTPQAVVEARRTWLLDSLDRDAAPIGHGTLPLSRDRIDHLVRDAEELYWNELAWEELTDEERVAGGHLTELVFPGFLAFVDGLLLDAPSPDLRANARPHPEVVEEILSFLGDRYAAAGSQLERGADSEKLVWARAMTAHLIDLVLFRLYGLTPAEREALESRE